MAKKLTLLPNSSTDDWIIALAHDGAGFAAAKKALAPMIQQVVARIGTDWTPLARRRAVATCNRLVTKAAQRYLSNFLKTRRQKFSTYYTWYVAQVVNNADTMNGSLPNEVIKRINDR